MWIRVHSYKATRFENRKSILHFSAFMVLHTDSHHNCYRLTKLFQNTGDPTIVLVVQINNMIAHLMGDDNKPYVAKQGLLSLIIVSIICTLWNVGHLAPCSWEPVVISLNCLLLNMNSTNETLLFDRFLIMYNLCVFTNCIILILVFHCMCECHMY